MALVSKIREKSGLIVFIVGLGLLLFIIPFDSIYAFFGGRGEQPIGEVYGKPIYPSEWDVMAEFNQNTGRFSTVPNGGMYKMHEAKNHFQRKMFDTIINTEIDKIGIRVSGSELKDYLIFGENPSQYVLNTVRSFYGMDEEVSDDVLKDSIPKMYNYFINQMNSATGDQKASLEAQWVYGVEKPAKRQRLIEKYFAMAKYAVVGTTDEATKLQIQQNSKLVVDFIAKEANTIMDTTVSVSEDKIKSYYEKHKEDEEWRTDEDLAKIDFVLINVEATEEDKAAMMENVAKMKKNFAEAKNDTAFIDLKSDVAFGENMQDPSVFDVIPGADFAGLFSENINNEIENAPAGSVVGPFTFTWQAEEIIVLAKVRSVARETKVRHILVNDKDLADSLALALKADTSQFSTLCEKYTQDPGYAQNNGYYDLGPASRFVPSFKTFSLENEAGSIDVVPSQFGFHVIEIVEKGELKRAMAYIVKDIVPSVDTRNVVYEEKGFGFMEAAQSNFSAALDQFGLQSYEATMQISIPVIDLTGEDAIYNSAESTIYNEELTNWLFADDRTAGDVSVPIELKDGRFLVARVKGTSGYGVPTYEIVKDEMKARLVKDAKMAKITKQLKGVGSIAEAESILGGSGATLDSEITLDMNGFPGVAQEDVKAIAKTFLINNLNELTIIEGKESVYVVVVKERNITPVASDKTEAIAKVSKNRQSYVERTINLALLKMADVRDWRVKAQVHYANTEN
ncbi:peptidylprolyl isomerase [Parvicella tangerina]|uniref:Periplasmic chaperone PpiD n=1 Tax=Parvicella tangerina TaxID=2829795 RepID=A0A916NIL5_9FLAO|nr:peptidylprolyl isomerase [Parvicella tangerina]CAG5084258.1 Chaperone SurA [Parvicella tangerina]